MTKFVACFIALAILLILLVGQSATSKYSIAFSPSPAPNPQVPSSSSTTLSTTNYACPSGPVASTRTNITSDSTPFGLAVDSANKNVYVSIQSLDEIQEINGASETMMSNSTPVGTNLKGLSYDSANGQLFVISQGNIGGGISPVVYWVNGEGTGATLPSDAVPIEMVYDSYNGYLYVSDYGSNQISVVNPSDPSDVTLVKNVAVGSRPWGLSVDPYNGYVFAADEDSNAISVISGTKVLGAIASNGTEPIGVLFDPINQMAYVTNSGSNSLAIINASGNTFSTYKLLNVITTAPLNDPEEMGLDCAHNSLWVANDGDNSLSAFLICPANSYFTHSVQYLASFASSSQPQELAFDNYTQDMYVTDYGSATVQVFPTSGMQSPLSKGYGCPMGVADYGINGQQTYSYTTTEFEAVTTFKSPFDVGLSSLPNYDHMASDQLNVMAYGVATDIPNGVYWVQNVLSLNQSNTCDNDTCYQFTSEFFNMTQPGASVDYKDTFASTCLKNGGTVYDDSTTFYCNTPWLSGLTFPLTVKMFLITGTETSGKYKGENYMSFEYELSDGPQANEVIKFDRWDFNNLLSGSSIPGDPHFLVSGNPMTTPWYSATQRCAPGGACPLLNDAENVLGGFASSASVNFTHVNAKMQLLYKDGSKLDFVPHAFSAGTDTAESALNVYSLGNAAQFAGTDTGNSKQGADDGIQIY